MIKLIKSTFHNEKKTKKKLVKFITDAAQLSFGNECNKFEKKFANWQGRKHCIFLNSGSSANLAIIQTLLNLGKLKKGDLVGFSALTWSTNVMPIIQLGLIVVPVDVELHTLNISSKKVAEIIEKFPIKMLFVTHLLGFCDDIDEIRNMCDEKGIILIEDTCESLGTIYKKKKLGNWGLASTFSFYVGHHMSTIEGGAVCTDNIELASMLRLVRAHGWDRNLSLAKQNKLRTKFEVNSTFYSRYTFYDLGFNLRPTEINGFLGNEQIKYLDIVIKKREENFKKIVKEIYKRTDKYYPIRFSHIELVSNFAVPIICKSKKIRDDLVEKCAGIIEIRPIVGGDMTQQPFIKKHMQMFAKILGTSNAQLIHDQGLYFGNNSELTSAEIKELINFFSRG